MAPGGAATAPHGSLRLFATGRGQGAGDRDRIERRRGDEASAVFTNVARGEKLKMKDLWAIKDKQALYKSYMPFVSGGGLFVPSTKLFSLGDEVFLLLHVMEFEERRELAESFLPLAFSQMGTWVHRGRSLSFSHIPHILL